MKLRKLHLISTKLNHACQGLWTLLLKLQRPIACSKEKEASRAIKKKKTIILRSPARLSRLYKAEMPYFHSKLSITV